MFSSKFNELFFTWKQLSHTFFPLSSITHLIILIDFLDYRFSVKTLLVHLENFNSLIQQWILLHLFTFTWLYQFLYFWRNRTWGAIKVAGHCLEDRLCKNDIWVNAVLQIFSLFLCPSLSLIFRSYCVWWFAAKVR
jgi:hypothetical protein